MNLHSQNRTRREITSSKGKATKQLMLNKFDFNPQDYVSLSEQTGESSTRQTYKGMFFQ